MTDKHYADAFKAALNELSRMQEKHDKLIAQEEALEERMDQLRTAALSLAGLADVDIENYPELLTGPDPRIGITKAVEQVLRESDVPLVPVDIRDGVFRISPSVAGHKNPLASIHAVLRRFVDNDRVVIITYPDGKIGYLWVDRDDFEEFLRKGYPTTPERVITRIKANRSKKR
jgi:hypothetical protein